MGLIIALLVTHSQEWRSLKRAIVNNYAEMAGGQLRWSVMTETKQTEMGAVHSVVWRRALYVKEAPYPPLMPVSHLRPFSFSQSLSPQISKSKFSSVTQFISVG